MRLRKKLVSGEFVILAEMEPPKGTDVSAMLANATRVKRQVDAYVIPEMGNAVMRMSSLGGALVLQGQGLETVLQCCCRDRNCLALQGDLLAAQALGVANVMAVPGDEITHGDHHQARAVHDLDLLELLGAIRTLQTGRDLAGVELQGAPQFFVGATVKIPTSDAARLDEIAALDKKAAAGASFFITPPVYEVEELTRFIDLLQGRPAHIIPTVLLLKSVGMARYINRHLEAKIPEEFIERIQKAPDRVRECVQIAAETIAALKAVGCRGVNLSTLGWEDKLPAILAGAGLEFGV